MGRTVAFAHELVEEQLQARHLVSFTSPWNTLIFVIKKSSGKWRLLQDLRAVNATMQPMGPLQQGLPSPVAIPQKWHLVVIDLKDCFISRPMHICDSPRFAFSLPFINFQEPALRYQWVVLPQGLAASPSICQMYVAACLDPLRRKFSSFHIVHYMDDVLLAASTKEKSFLMFAEL